MPTDHDVVGVSTSSDRIKSALDPVSWPKMPTALTDGLWSGIAGLTSNRFTADRCSSRSGSNAWSNGISRIRRMQNMVKSSARIFEADTTMIFFWGSSRSNHST